ncbi:MAG: hypothetical protein WBF06_08400 [Candidatus Acidiferrales bacterium]
MFRRFLRTFLWLLIFAVELGLCLALVIGARAILATRRLDRDAGEVRVTAPAEHPQLNFACQMETPALQSLFSDPDAIRDLRQLNAGVTLSLIDLSPGRAQVVRQLNAAGIPVTAWLALPGAQGYYLNASNAADAGERFTEFQKWTGDWGLRWSGVGLDIEPNLQEFTSVHRAVWAALKRLVDPHTVTRARIAYTAFIARIEASGYQVETYQFPFIADEREVRSTLLERLFGIVDVRGDREVLMLYSSYNLAADSALIWQYGPSAQGIVVGITAGEPQAGARMGPLSWEELSHDVIVASHFSAVVGIYNLEGCVHRGLLARLEGLDWNLPVIISADQNRQVIRFRARVQATLWAMSRLPYFALAILLADTWFLSGRRRRARI